jgi:hypothetical protein
VRGAHHYAFHDGLAANERLFPAFENGEHLDMYEKAKKIADRQFGDL